MDKPGTAAYNPEVIGTGTSRLKPGTAAYEPEVIGTGGGYKYEFLYITNTPRKA